MSKRAELLSSTRDPNAQTIARPSDPKAAGIHRKLLDCQKALETGKLGAAGKLLDELRVDLPGNADVRQMDGILAHRQGNHEEAAARLREAIKIDPTRAQHYLNLAVAYRAMGQAGDAQETLRAALRLDPNSPAIHRNLGNLLSDSGDFEASVTHYEKSLKTRPGHSETWLNYLFALVRAGRLKDSLARLSEAEEHGVERIQALHAVGQWLLQRARGADAVAYFAEALQVDEGNRESLLSMGTALIQVERPKDADFFFDTVLEENPDDVGAISGKAAVCIQQGRHGEARTYLERCIELAPKVAKFYGDLAAIAFRQDDMDEAERLCRRALELNPDLPSAHSMLASVEKTHGNFEAAIEHFDKAFGKLQQEGGLFNNLYSIKKDISEEDDVAVILSRLEAQETTSKSDLMAYNYALGGVFDQLNSPERATFYYKAANELRRIELKAQGHIYNRDQAEKIIQANENIFTLEFFEARKGLGSDSERPVFIVGMPRSGTTLTEQIVSSHPQAFGAGELPKMNELLSGHTRALMADGGQKPYPLWVPDLGDEQIREFADKYLEHLKELAGENPIRVTDKMPHNFMNVGMIALMFPNARIIHCMRDPVDTCLSCFRQNFAMPHAYSTNLADVGHHHRQYQRIMAHWRKVLPVKFYEVQYEELVKDQERVTRELIDFCGLEWDDACLRFNEQKRDIKTASVWQVRQPIYKQSVKKWKPYAPYIGEMLDELGISASDEN
ncbi:tetratricopeptide repeat-containing sulfotransferase family protein [Ferruginivarius sediminum]|nr:tetratricopeptide repeat-containing sulfotransferase family protein [Ferruginivarius sediminum]